MTGLDWAGTCFVANPQNVPLTLVPEWVTTLAVQVAWGTTPQDLGGFVEQCEGRFYLVAWAWCQGPDVEAEAELHGRLARGFVGYVANMEEPYDAHGNQGDARFGMPRRYLAALDWDGPLGVTTTPQFGSDMSAWIERGAIYMPQAFPYENSAEIDDAVFHGQQWGWPIQQQRPLAQCYTTNGQRPSGAVMNTQATELGVGLIPYVVEQAMDDGGMHWLAQAKTSIERPTLSTPPAPLPPDPDQGDEMTVIGSQHGITAYANWLRQQPNVPPRGAGYKPDDIATWPWPDKIERTLTILAADHDEQAKS